MMRRQRGFTLIELLIVVAIIGIIAAIAIPNLLNALNRGRQKRTMADMRTVATAIGSYSVDMGYYPRSVNDIGTLKGHLEPVYIRNAPAQDGWRTTYQVLTDAAGAHYTLHSYGRDKADGNCTYNTQTSDFDCDICHSDGTFTQWPEGIQQDA